MIGLESDKKGRFGKFISFPQYLFLLAFLFPELMISMMSKIIIWPMWFLTDDIYFVQVFGAELEL